MSFDRKYYAKIIDGRVCDSMPMLPNLFGIEGIENMSDDERKQHGVLPIIETIVNEKLSEEYFLNCKEIIVEENVVLFNYEYIKPVIEEEVTVDNSAS